MSTGVSLVPKCLKNEEISECPSAPVHDLYGRYGNVWKRSEPLKGAKTQNIEVINSKPAELVDCKIQ